jgi:peptidoglycan pentaglycine glycine transferase (the first glycine)
MDLQFVKIENPQQWNTCLNQDLNGHFLQSWEWGQFKGRFGWTPHYLAWKNDHDQIKAAALVLKRFFSSYFSILYCPRGPSLDWSDKPICSSVLSDLQTFANSEGSIFLKIDPDVALGEEKSIALDGLQGLGKKVTEQLREFTWRPSAEQIQFRNSMLLDLRPSEDELLSRMKQKTRYNVRLASRRGVTVRKGDHADLELLYRLYAETSLRDRFTIRESAYYQDAWGSFIKAGMAQPFIAEVNGEPVAAIVIFHFGKRAIYMYGMSRDLHREKMPNHLLQWEAIMWAKSRGYTLYDFWGAPDNFTEEDPMWGVYRFKKGYGAEVLRTIGAWDYIAKPMLYKLYSIVLPRILAMMRLRGRALTSQSLQ